MLNNPKNQDAGNNGPGSPVNRKGGGEKTVDAMEQEKK